MNDEVERIANRKTLDALANHGDDSRIARVVKHWAFFPSAPERSFFKSSVLARTFELDCEYEIDDCGHPFVICFTKVQRVTEIAINETTVELNALAEEYSGEYDGWETQVETQ